MIIVLQFVTKGNKDFNKTLSRIKTKLFEY